MPQSIDFSPELRLGRRKLLDDGLADLGSKCLNGSKLLERQGTTSLVAVGNQGTLLGDAHRESLRRRAMVRPERELLGGEVEVDETYLAISDRDKPLSSEGRKSKTSKIMVAIAVEIHQPKGFGRIRFRRIDDGSDACVVPFVQENIEPGALVRTDGSAAYRSLSQIGFEHNRHVMLGAELPAHVTMPGVHRVPYPTFAGSWRPCCRSAQGFGRTQGNHGCGPSA